MQEYLSLDKTTYQEICLALNINPKLDRKATKLLHKLMSYKAIQNTVEKLEKQIAGKTVFVFGAGPSLEDSINEVQNIISRHRDEIAIVAVDGAANALYVNNIDIDVVVSDLDGCFKGIKEELFTDSIVVIHGHSNNIEKLHELSHILRNEGILGTTQGRETKRIFNFGGFSDGDRAVHLIANFHASKIIIFGFDFGTVVGRFSKPESEINDLKAKESKLVKFKFAKELLGKLPALFQKTEFYNATIDGEVLKEFKVIKSKDIEALF